MGREQAGARVQLWGSRDRGGAQGWCRLNVNQTCGKDCSICDCHSCIGMRGAPRWVTLEGTRARMCRQEGHAGATSHSLLSLVGETWELSPSGVAGAGPSLDHAQSSIPALPGTGVALSLASVTPALAAPRPSCSLALQRASRLVGKLRHRLCL